MSAALALLIGLLVGRFGVNLVHSDARGAQPLRELASSGNPSVRDAARAGLLVVDSTAFFGNVEWVAVVDQRAHGDTIVLSLYRAQDATVLRRMVMPHPYIGGVVRYDMARHHLVTATVSIE
jgi:hypothetical protein